MSFNEELITCVYKNTVLWGPKRKDHKNKTTIDKLLKSEERQCNNWHLFKGNRFSVIKLIFCNRKNSL